MTFTVFWTYTDKHGDCDILAQDHKTLDAAVDHMRFLLSDPGRFSDVTLSAYTKVNE